MITVKFKIEYIIIAIIISFNLVFHFIADFNSGYHGDELLYIEAGRHLAFGYMDFSPMIAFLAWIQNLFQSQSIFINHLFLHIATAVIILLCGLITIELGGKWLAILVTLSCIMFSPGFGASQSLFLPDVFDQLSWVICIYYLVKFCKNPENKYLTYIGIFAAIGFLTKYTIVFLICGFVLSFLIFQFNIIKKKALWISLIIFLIIISPNILWQFNNGFPVFHHFSKLYETQLGNISLIKELKSLFIYMNPFTSIFWISGLIAIPFIHKFKPFRLVTYTLLFAFLFLILARGKSYYYFPVILGILPFSAVFFEQILHQRLWILSCYLSLICFSGIILLPHGIPILPLDKYIQYYNFKKNCDNRIPLPFENYYSKGTWNQILLKVNETYSNLSVAEQKKCLVWGRHYSQAGGINLLGNQYGLPQAFSFHSSFFSWVPDFSNNITVIVISDFSWDKEHWLRYFKEVEEVDTIKNIYASDNEWFIQHIFLCRKLKYNSAELKRIFKNEIF